MTGRQSWNSFSVEVGDAANYLYDNSGTWKTAMDHPIAAGAITGVVGGLAFAGASTAATALSAQYLGGIGTACISFCNQADKTVKLINNTQSILSSGQRDAIYQTIQDSRLQGIFNKLYQTTDKLPGGTAGAIKYESQTGQLLSPAGHLQKGMDTINAINKIMQNQNLSQGDWSIAQTLVNQLKDAVK